MGSHWLESFGFSFGWSYVRHRLGQNGVRWLTDRTLRKRLNKNERVRRHNVRSYSRNFRHNKQQIKRALIERSGPFCADCRKSFTASLLTIDHIRPASKGGTSEFYNLQLLCRPCHDLKSLIDGAPTSASYTLYPTSQFRELREAEGKLSGPTMRWPIK